MGTRKWTAFGLGLALAGCADPATEASLSAQVLVPAGDFYMGCDKTADPLCDTDEGPQHRVTLPAYRIDQTEVTAAQFKACVDAGACTPPGNCQWGPEYLTYGVAAKADHPVNCVDWSQASAYCAWAGRRLCTEAEWEKAARGGCETVAEPCAANMRRYPWGAAAATCANTVMSEGGLGCGADSTAAVGSKPSGASPYGALDMAGNVWEWVSDWYGRNYFAGSPEASPEGPASGTGRVFHGGAFDGEAAGLRASNRVGNAPTDANASLGLRCCGPVP